MKNIKINKKDVGPSGLSYYVSIQFQYPYDVDFGYSDNLERFITQTFIFK